MLVKLTRTSNSFKYLFNPIRLFTMTSNSTRLSVAILVIGDEILKGRVKDTNSAFAISQLSEWGVDVRRISVVGDDVDAIGEEVLRFSNSFDFVLTTGGIGPTEDDRTYGAIAKAFGVELALNAEIAEAVEKSFGKKEASDSMYRLATVPSGASLVWNKSKDYPIVRLHNIFILPGVPQIFERILPNIGGVFLSRDKNGVHKQTPHSYTRCVYLKNSEVEVSNQINKVFAQFQQVRNVKIGSYPNWSHNYYKTKVTIDSSCEDTAQQVETFLRSCLPEDSVFEDLIEDPVGLLPHSVYSFQHPHLSSSLVLQSLQVVHSALEKYSPENTVLSFNGGKDCTLILHLYLAVIRKHFPEHKANLLFIETGESFPEVTQFIHRTKLLYDIGAYYHIKSASIVQALQTLHRSSPQVYAIIMGTRSTDPGGHAFSEFMPCDPQYGTFLRVNPILSWNYAHIWTFIRTLQIPYCVLYDQGYTSLGIKSKTHKNPELFVETRGSRDVYRPAYTLVAHETERCARD